MIVLYRGKRTSNSSYTLHDVVNHLLADGIMSTSVVVGSILLATDQQLGVEELTIAASSDLIDRGGVQIDEEGSGDIFAIAGFGEEGLERTSIADILGIGIGTAISAKTVLEQVANKSSVGD
jgi:hypothetical protein